MRPLRPNLWRHRDFMKLWSGQTISLFGSHIGGSALRFTAILFLGATPFQLGVLTAAQMAPALLLGLLAGVWVDRLRRRPILIAADLGRGLLLLSVPLAFALGLLRIEQLYVVAALAGALTIFFDVAYGAFLPTVIGREQLVEGNSKLGASDSLAEIAGPPAGGILVQLISAPLAILFDALSFFMSALAIWRIGAPEAAPLVSSASPNLRREVADGLRAVLHNPLLRPLLGAGVTLSLFGNIIGALYDLYLIRELGLSPALIGLTIGIGGVSALFGAFLAAPVVARFGIGPTLGGVLILKIGTISLLPLAHGPYALAMLMIGQAGDVLFAIYAIAETSLRQSIAPERMLGRINASFNVLITGAGLCGALLGGVLAESIGTRGALVVAAIGISTACLWIVLSPLWRVRRAPEVALGIEPYS
ncbi:MAG TPA: MFS transporter [Roseiflexaceae bacterium]|nr:MFS transporter [Roseiflexaceae bacterium]